MADAIPSEKWPLYPVFSSGSSHCWSPSPSFFRCPDQRSPRTTGLNSSTPHVHFHKHINLAIWIQTLLLSLDFPLSPFLPRKSLWPFPLFQVPSFFPHPRLALLVPTFSGTPASGQSGWNVFRTVYWWNTCRRSVISTI